MQKLQNSVFRNSACSEIPIDRTKTLTATELNVCWICQAEITVRLLRCSVINHLSCRLREGLADALSRLEPDASLFPADSISVQPANSAHNFSTRLRIGSVACLIRSSTDLMVKSSADVLVPCESISDSCLNLNSIVSEEQ